MGRGPSVSYNNLWCCACAEFSLSVCRLPVRLHLLGTQAKETRKTKCQGQDQDQGQGMNVWKLESQESVDGMSGIGPAGRAAREKGGR